jgi:hypothetical protein
LKNESGDKTPFNFKEDSDYLEARKQARKQAKEKESS